MVDLQLHKVAKHCHARIPSLCWTTVIRHGEKMTRGFTPSTVSGREIGSKCLKKGFCVYTVHCCEQQLFLDVKASHSAPDVEKLPGLHVFFIPAVFQVDVGVVVVWMNACQRTQQ